MNTYCPLKSFKEYIFPFLSANWKSGDCSPTFAGFTPSANTLRQINMPKLLNTYFNFIFFYYLFDYLIIFIGFDVIETCVCKVSK